MKTQTKPLYKTLVFWEICITLVIVLALAVFIGAELSKPLPEPPEPTQTTETSAQEPILPPPTANPFTPADFAYEGGYMTCLAMDAVLGIDVSFWQADVQWQQVRDAGMEFAMIRLGFRGSQQGGLEEDAYVRANYAGATEAGLKVGGYFFSQAISVEEAVEEAEYVLEIIKDWKVGMPIVYDWEYMGQDARTAHVDARTLTDCTKAFCEVIEKAGYEAMVYFNQDQSHELLYLEELTDYRFWLAMYDPVMDYPYRVDMWQYTCEGTVPGINGNVDINLFFDYSDS